MTQIKYVNKTLLMQINTQAIREGANRTIQTMTVELLDSDTFFNVSQTMLHNDGLEVRCKIILDCKGSFGWIDMPLETFNSLPVLEIDDTTVTIPKAEYDELYASANDECHDMFNDLCAQYVKEEEEDNSNEIASRTYEYRCDTHGTFFDTNVARESVRCPRENCDMPPWIIRPVPGTLEGMDTTT
jgi:hypothetical protein